MKIKEGFILRKVNDTGVVVPVGEATRTFDGMIMLNETGAFLWGLLQEEADRAALIDALLTEYETTHMQAEKDVDGFIEKLREANLLAE